MGPRSTGNRDEVKEDQQGDQLFLKMSQIWAFAMPPVFKGENPQLAAKLLELAGLPEGVSQTQLKQDLGLDQSRASRLCTRLKKEGWVTEDIPRGDGRLRFIRLTPTARESLQKLRMDLTNACATLRSAAEKTKAVAEPVVENAQEATQNDEEKTKNEGPAKTVDVADWIDEMLDGPAVRQRAPGRS